MNVKKKIKQLLNRLPYIKGLHSDLERYRTFYPPGHFYSPIPDIESLKRDEHKVFGLRTKELPGIDLREAEQVNLLEELKGYYGALPFGEEPAPDRRYYLKNPMFNYSDAIFLHCLIRHFKPARIVEVGSGFSSAVMLDTNDAIGRTMNFTFIEPYPDRLMGLLREADRNDPAIRVITSNIQELGLDAFARLEAHDMLFVDSSHVAKTHSDVNYILFEILPSLKRGVLVHFHDIMFPFEYPKEWVFRGRVYNESYFLRAFLQYNSAFGIVAWNSFLNQFHHEWLQANMPLCVTGNQSLWLEKL